MFAGLALVVAARRDDRNHTLAATGLLTIAIVSHHFTAMGAVTLVADPDPRHRRIDDLAGRAFLSDRGGGVRHSRHIVRGGVARSPFKQRAAPAEGPARLGHHKHVAGTLHVRCGRPHHAVQPALQRDDGSDQHAAAGPFAGRRSAGSEIDRKMGRRSRGILQHCGDRGESRREPDPGRQPQRTFDPRRRSAQRGRWLGRDLRGHHRMAGGPGADHPYGAP